MCGGDCRFGCSYADESVRVRREHALWGEARVREVEVGGGGLHASEVLGGGGRGFPGGR